MSTKRRGATRHSGGDRERRAARLRIIGGHLRGRTFDYDGHGGTRPMKDRVREAVFNLIGPAVRDKTVIDLFAGTGAMAFESLSRGASRAILMERRFPTARVIRDNADQLGLAAQVEVITGDAFVWSRKLEPTANQPWLAFICPPYEFFVGCRDQMLALLGDLVERSPAGSVFVVECDERFSTDTLSAQVAWDVRQYPPAVIAVGERRTKPPAAGDDA